MDGALNQVRAWIQPRAYALKNRERTNRLLMLMQLHLNRQDDSQAYTKLIRAELEANRGRPRLGRETSPTPAECHSCAEHLPHPRNASRRALSTLSERR